MNKRGVDMPDATDQRLLEALLDSWDRNNTILLNLLRVLPEGGLQARAMESSPSVAELFTHIHFVESDTGEVVAQLSVGEAEFWLADESPDHFNFSPESLDGGSVRMVMTVEDPDAAFERAVTAGATVVWPVSDQHGWRIGRIVDPFGHHWEIGKPL